MTNEQIKAQMVAMIEEQPERYIAADRTMHVWVLAEACARADGALLPDGGLPFTYVQAALEVDQQRTKPRIIHGGA